MSKVLVLTVIEADYQWDDEELVVKASDYGQLKEKLWHSEMAAEALKAERDALRKQLDGALEVIVNDRELLEQARKGSTERWATDAKGTLELVARATVLRAERLSWRAIAVRLGVDPSTLARARRKHPMPDPLGAELKRAEQRAFTQR